MNNNNVDDLMLKKTCNISENVKRKYRRWCFVPLCKNTERKNPEKVFVSVPKAEKLRKQWFLAANRAVPLTSKSCFYCCEDHFDLPNDMENYLRWTILKGPMKMKEGVLPYIFDCQSLRTAEKNLVPRLFTESLPRKRLLREIHETPCYSEIKTEVIEFKLEDLHHSIDIKEEPDEEDKLETSEMLMVTCENDAQEVSLKSHFAKKPFVCEFKLEDFHHSIDIKEEPDQEDKLETAEMLVTCENDAQEVFFKTHNAKKPFGYEFKLEDLHHSINIKEEPDREDKLETAEMLMVTSENDAQEVSLKTHIVEKPFVYEFKLEDLHHSFDIKEEPDQEDKLETVEMSVTWENDAQEVFFKTHNAEKPFGCEFKLEDLHHSIDIKEEPNREDKLETVEMPVTWENDAQEVFFKTHNAEKPFVCEFKLEDLHHSIDIKEEPDEEDKLGTAEMLVTCENDAQDKPFACKMCDYKCARKADLITHFRTHSGEKPFRCGSCEYECARKDMLTRHLRTHTGAKPYTCKICNNKYTGKEILAKHLRTHTGEKPFNCDLCEYKCVQKGQLQRHLRTHTGEKPFMCDLCDFKCSDNGNLKRHVVSIHTGEKSLACDICDYTCVHSSYLKQHLIMRHSDEKSFVCEICNGKFATQLRLKQHSKTHSKDKPFSCHLCDYKCLDNGNLKRHLIIRHTGEKSFTCNVCAYKCAHKSYLRQHLRIHTGEKPFTCSFCDYKCAGHGNFNRHIRIHHAGEKQLTSEINHDP